VLCQENTRRVCDCELEVKDLKEQICIEKVKSVIEVHDVIAGSSEPQYSRYVIASL